MEDTKKSDRHMCDGACGGCENHICPVCRMGRHHRMARLVLGVILLGFVFWVGIMLGELKGFLRESYYNGGYGQRMPHGWMMGYDGEYPNDVRSFDGMMPRSGTQGYAPAAPNANNTPSQTGTPGR